MMEHKIYYGTLEKTEQLIPVDIASDISALVYESRSPFFGYYDDYPGKHNDNIYYYLVLDHRMTFAEMHRVILKANKAIDFTANMDHATLTVSHNTYTAIRLRYLSDLNQVAQLYHIFEGLGMEFNKGRSKGEASSKTKIIKYFDLDDMGEGVWIDRVAKNHAYLQLPERVELEDFKALVQRVRNNWDGNSFDAGLGVLITKDEVIEVARIYSKSLKDEGYLDNLQKVINSVF